MGRFFSDAVDKAEKRIARLVEQIEMLLENWSMTPLVQAGYILYTICWAGWSDRTIVNQGRDATVQV
jgi:hypothetical protein